MIIAKLKKLLLKLLSKSNEVYYINGPELLFPPLDPEKEAELIKRIDCDKDAKEITIPVKINPAAIICSMENRLPIIFWESSRINSMPKIILP